VPSKRHGLLEIVFSRNFRYVNGDRILSLQGEISRINKQKFIIIKQIQLVTRSGVTFFKEIPFRRSFLNETRVSFALKKTNPSGVQEKTISNASDERPTHRVIPPFLTGLRSRIHAAIFSFCAGVTPPMPILGRSLL
jgi:hypothetical protein